MTDTAVFDATLADFLFGPDEGLGVFIVGLDESVDVLAKLGDGGEGRAVQGFSFQDRKPDLHLIEPGGPCRREVEPYLRVTLEPAVVLGLVGVERCLCSAPACPDRARMGPGPAGARRPRVRAKPARRPGWG